MLKVRVEDMVLPIHTAWGLPIRKYPITEGGVESQIPELDDELEGCDGVKC